MKITILNASMEHDENGYLGRVGFQVEGHKEEYEIILQSKKGREWGYALNFLHDSGPDEEIDLVDEYIDENDEVYDKFIQAAKEAMVSK